MKFLNKYPEGALRSVNEVREIAHRNGILYFVNNLGSRSWITPMQATYVDEKNFVNGFETRPFSRRTFGVFHSLKDANVILNTYNDHFVFSDMFMAETYLDYAILDNMSDILYDTRF